VPDVTTYDRLGRVVLVTDVRPLPEVTGTFRHVVHAGDRLDHLAATYAGRPDEWWHLCDANPQVLFPPALVGADVVGTTEFPLPGPGDPPPWDRLLRTLASLDGVEGVRVVDDVELHQRPVGPDRRVVSWEERPVRAVRVTHNRSTIDAAAIAEAIRELPLPVGPFVELGREGYEIVVPPPVGR
jgi:hypothetical protein